MYEEQLGRVEGDLAVMRRAMGLHPAFGKGMLLFGVVLAAAAAGAAAVRLLRAGNDSLQVAPVAAILVCVPIGLYLRSRRNAGPGHEASFQVLMSVTIYAVVWVAACGYMLAAVLGAVIGAAATAGLYATSIGVLLAFTLMLVRGALRSRERHYCLGLATSTLLAGMLLPVIDRHYSFALANCFMAVGYLTGAVIQSVQLREAVANHAAD